MRQIDIDFEVYKAMTAMRHTEEHSYNDVIRELLGLEVKQITSVYDDNAQAGAVELAARGLRSRGLFLPDGTKLRATYKGNQFNAKVEGGVIINKAGTTFMSPSAAASEITKTTVNGWRFWEGKRPADTEWRRLDQLP